MTFDDDFLRFTFPNGTTTHIAAKDAGVSWPPPEKMLVFDPSTGRDVLFCQDSCSVITDDQRTTMTHVCRGAAYQVATS
jgi:hypothetical protein